MNPLFVQALERLGASGAAWADWQYVLGDAIGDCADCLVANGLTANYMLDPAGSSQRLRIEPNGDGGFVGIHDDDPHSPPLPVHADQIKMFRPDARAIGLKLADRLGFAHGDWESTFDPLRRIGTMQEAGGRTTPVWLFLPPGTLGDYAMFIRHLADLSDATILVPTARWITRETSALAKRHGLSLHALDAPPTAVLLQPAGASGNASPRNRAPHAIIRPVTGLGWSNIEIIIRGNRTLTVRAPGQSGEYRFPSNIKLTPEHPLGMLMTVAAKGEWRNPPKTSPNYERISRSFRRLQKLLATLIPLPGKPFQLSQGAHLPRFQTHIESKTFS